MNRHYFVAIPIAEEVVDEILDIQEGIEDARWVPPEKMHLTLHFLGDLPESSRKEVAEIMECLPFTPFELTPQGLGLFPHRGPPHVLWLGVEPSEELKALHKKVHHKLITMGFKGDERRFIPHITLARFENASVEEIQRYISLHQLRKFSSFLVDEIYLYSSRLTKAGTFYQIE